MKMNDKKNSEFESDNHERWENVSFSISSVQKAQVKVAQ